MRFLVRNGDRATWFISLIAQSSTAGSAVVCQLGERAVDGDLVRGDLAEADPAGVDDVPAGERVEADQPHARRVQGDRVAAGQQDVQVDRVAVDRPAALHADQPVHQRRG